jgi:glucose dehydrogenase
MQTQEADGWGLTMFIHPKEVGKRMVVDREKGQNQIRVQEVQSGRQASGRGRQVQSQETGKGQNRED